MWIRLAYLYILCFDKAFEIFIKVFKFSDPVLSPVNHLPKPGPGPGPGPLKNTGDNRGRGPRSDVSRGWGNRVWQPGLGPGPLKNTGDNRGRGRGRGPRSDVSLDLGKND